MRESLKGIRSSPGGCELSTSKVGVTAKTGQPGWTPSKYSRLTIGRSLVERAVMQNDYRKEATALQ